MWFLIIYPTVSRIFAKEEQEVSRYENRMDEVINKAVKEALIQVQEHLKD